MSIETNKTFATVEAVLLIKTVTSLEDMIKSLAI